MPIVRNHLCLFILFCGLLIYLPIARALDDEQLRNFQNCIVRIEAAKEAVDYRTPWNSGGVGRGYGTAFHIGGGRLMTNAHVVSNARFLGLKKEGEAALRQARVRYIAHDCDLALLEVEEDDSFEDMPALEFGGLPSLHSTVEVLGYPIGGERMSVTKGVVSRIEFRPYAHSGTDSHLAIQIDAAINPGNSGGPVLQDGKVVGIAFQGVSGKIAQNTGYMIPMPVVNRFLTDLEDGVYDGYAELGVDHFNLTNPSYRARLGLPGNGLGVVVTSVLKGGSSDGALERGDVLLAIDGYPIAADGRILLDRDYVQLEEIVERKFIGDKVTLALARDGRQEETDIVLKGAGPYRIHTRRYDERPRYLVFAGLVFQPVEHNLLATAKQKPPEVMDMYAFYIQEELYVDHPEIVVLSRILPDPVNTHMDGFRMQVVDTVNDRRIGTFAELDEALRDPAPRYIIRFIGESLPLVIEAGDVSEADARVAEQYQIPAMKRLEAVERAEP